jgi:glycosyltransferase involved in cell wall biosynthesis
VREFDFHQPTRSRCCARDAGKGGDLKVLHLITWLVPGGIEKWLLSMLAEIPRNECAMDIACKGVSTGPLAHVAEAAGARVLHCPLTPVHFGFARQMKQILREGKYDIVHNHLANYSGFATWIARGRSTPSIASYHNTEFPPETWTRRPGLRQLRDAYSQRSMSYALRNSQFVTGCSEAVLESLTAYAPRKENWRILPYGIEVPPPPGDAARRALRAEFGWSPETPVVLHVGRFIEQKNHVGLLEIFARISKEIPAARLLLVGEGPLQSEIQNEISARGLEDKAVCAGVRSDVPQLMSNSDLFLFPSFHEGFGLVAIEANGAGLPVVASKIPGVTEAVADQETAFLFPLPGVQEMADASIELLNNPDLRKQMGEAGRARVRQKFTRAASAQNLLQLYRDCLAQGGSTLRL